jgi:phosphoribosylanthranilate isomerase
MTFVKICGITSIEDALHAERAGADAIGFNFWRQGKRYVAPAVAAEIGRHLGDALTRVGVFVDADPDEIESIAETAGLHVAQVHGTLSRPLKMRWWQALPATRPGIRETMERSGAEAFLIDTPAGVERGGTGRTFDWSLATGLPGRVLLAGGLAADNVVEAIRTVRPWGVDACSRLEFNPGRKDPGKVEEFIRAVRSANV